MALTNRRIGKLLREGRPGRYADRGGLYFRIAPGGSTGWLLRMMVVGRRVERGLGGYPAVSLTEARSKSRAAARALRQNGADLGPSKPPRSASLTLRDVTLRAHKAFSPDWGKQHREQWLASLERHVLPQLGDRIVGEITQADVLDTLEPLYERYPRSAATVRTRLRRVFAYAVSRQLAHHNVAGEAIDGALRRRRPMPVHHRAPHHSEIPQTFASVRASLASRITVLALEWLAHSAGRTSEGIGMRWTELDDGWTEWTIPAARSKDGREHRKPVTRQMRSILTAARKAQEIYHGGVGERVFPAGISTLRSLFRILCIDHSTHGLRSSFRSWALEVGERWDCAETQLSHSLGNAVAMAYIRRDLVDDLMEQRREMMRKWSDLIDSDNYWHDLGRLLMPEPRIGGAVG